MSRKQLLHEKSLRYAAVISSFLKRKVIIGVMGVLLLYTSVAMISVLSYPWWPGKGDGPYHADYAHQLYKGGFPNWDEGMRYPVFKEKIDAPGPSYPGDYKHIASPHPPLFYAIQAPFMGPLMDDGKWEKALAVGRTINVILGIILGVLMAYAAWLYGGRYRSQLAVLVPLFGLLVVSVIYLSNRLMNDTPVIIFSTLTMIVTYFIFKKGISLSSIIAYSIIVSLGMLTKATFVTVLIPSYLLIAYMIFKQRDSTPWKKMTLWLAIPVIVVLSVSGWFYTRNYMESGDFTRTGSQTWVADRRDPKDLKQVLTTLPLYTVFYRGFTHPDLSTAITASVVVSLLYVASQHKSKTRRLVRKNAPLLLMFTGIALLVLAAQIKHAIPYGAYGTRYFLPLLFPVSLIFAFGLMNIPGLRKYWGVLLAIIISLLTLGSYASQSVPDSYQATVLGRLQEAFINNYVPIIFLYILIVSGVVAILMIIYSLRTPTNKLRRDSKTSVGV